MQSTLSNVQALNMVPHIESPESFKHHYSTAAHKTGFTVLDVAVKEESRPDSGPIPADLQVGEGSKEITLITPTEADVARARESLTQQHINSRKKTKAHSLVGRGKGKSSRSRKPTKKKSKPSARKRKSKPTRKRTSKNKKLTKKRTVKKSRR